YLRFLIDALASDLNEAHVNVTYQVTEAEEEALEFTLKANLSWTRYVLKCSGIILDLFAGQLLSSLRCFECHYVSTTFDVFWDLSVPLNKSPLHACTLQACLSEFSKQEELEKTERYFCPKCRKKQKSSKQLQVYRLPPILVIHLKRFNSSYRKLTTPVSFPLVNLDVSMITTAPTEVRYALISVLHHSGSLMGGHYVASVFHKNHWYRLNDAYVQLIPPEHVMTQVMHDAYVLFYQVMS
ncbi:hypothetical protein HMI55_001922, partial [Coelomomyces lativittatus]